GVDVVYRNIKETLDLVCVEIHRHHTLDADNLQHVGHHLRRNGYTGRAGATILARVPEIGNRGGDATSRSTAQSIHHDHDFHEIVIGGCARWLENENILASDVLVDFHHDLAVRETSYGHFA